MALREGERARFFPRTARLWPSRARRLRQELTWGGARLLTRRAAVASSSDTWRWVSPGVNFLSPLPRCCCGGFDFGVQVGVAPRERPWLFWRCAELRKAGEVSLEQAGSFASIRVARAGVERKEQEWIARSA
jgi:hypothetical protein